MRNTNRVFSQGERKGFMWVLIVTAIVAAAIAGYDRIAGPSLGIYGQDMQGASLPGVLEAQPLS